MSRFFDYNFFSGTDRELTRRVILQDICFSLLVRKQLDRNPAFATI